MLTVDLTEVSYCDSAAVRALFTLAADTQLTMIVKSIGHTTLLAGSPGWIGRDGGQKGLNAQLPAPVFHHARTVRRMRSSTASSSGLSVTCPTPRDLPSPFTPRPTA